MYQFTLLKFFSLSNKVVNLDLAPFSEKVRSTDVNSFKNLHTIK